MHTIGYLVKHFALSRSTLLYYDKIGLLKPMGRSRSNYRLYTDADIQKMQLIAVYKAAGLALEDIAKLIEEQSDNETRCLLEQRLLKLNEEISDLRGQQKTLVDLLGSASSLSNSKVMNKQQWVAILRASGMNDDDMRNWHIEFEASMPQAHEDFLQSLGIDASERKVIRNHK